MGEIMTFNVVVNFGIFLVTGSAAWFINEIMAYLNPDRLADGFFDINDARLAYPRRNTLPLSLMVTSIIWTSVIVVVLGELSSVLRGKFSVKTAIYNAISVYGIFLFGWFIHALWVMTTKGVVLSPRPHFLESCKPDLSKVSDTSGLLSLDICTANQKTMKDATGSFPSGHAAIAYYACFFWLFYIQTKLPSNTPKMISAFVQALAFVVSFLSSVTRIVDNRHFWSDVIVGIIFGVMLALWMGSLCGIIPKIMRANTSKEPSVRAKTE